MSKRTSKRLSNKTVIFKESSSDESDSDEPLKSKPKLESLPYPELKLSESDDSSSESDLGTNLKSSNKIDLDSPFFEIPNIENKPKDEFQNIENKIFDHVDRLSDSDEESDSKEELVTAVPSTSADPPNQVSNIQANTTFDQLANYKQELEDTKNKILHMSKNISSKEEKIDINALLAQGETNYEDNTYFNFSEDEKDDSDSEMEEVKPEKMESKPVIPASGLQITLDLPNPQKEKKKVDVMAQIKRKINRVKKEYQVYIHKVHLLCWIAHGHYVNRILNNEKLMALSLSLIPNENCYPEGRIDLNYVEKITNWFSKAFTYKVTSRISVEDYMKGLPLDKALQLQITKKSADSKKNFILIFICMLRSIGIQCRLILSFRVTPLRPPSHELCSLSTKNNPKDTKIKKEINKPKPIPQIDGQNDPDKKRKLHSGVRKNDSSVSSSPEVATMRRISRCKKSPEVTEDDLSDTEHFQSKSLVVRKSRSSAKKEMVVKSSFFQKENRSSSRKETPKKEEQPETTSSNQKKSNEEKTSTQKGKKETKVRDTSKREDNLKKRVSNGAKETPKKESVRPKRSKSENVHPETKPAESENPKKKTVKQTRSKSVMSRGSNVPVKVPEKPPIKKSPGTQSSFFNKSPKKKSVANDIIHLVKSRISEQIDIDKRKLAPTKKKPKVVRSSDDDDSDFSPKPIKKKSRKSVDSDDDFIVSPKQKIKTKVDQLKRNDRKVLSTDSENDSKEVVKIGNDVWVEVFLEDEEKWISVDVLKGQVHCTHELFSRASQPVSYIVGWKNDGTLKDVTSRYCVNWNTVTRKLRVDPAWWEETLRPYVGKKTARDREEDELAQQQIDQPLPKVISEYKNHPLYVLKRHLLKFEAIYPPDAVTLGFIRNEPVFARECVYTLHSRETWVKQAKVVKPGEKPYKIVKARPKYDRLTGNVTKDIPLEIFGPWQVKDYEPPVAENGIVPRNPYGNVDLFKPCMLPVGTVHLQLPGLNRVARKLQIDCAPAMIGFDYHSGGSHPTFDGYVVCKEYEKTLMEAWEQEQEEAEKRAQERIEKRVYDNWKRLIKGLLIRERLKHRYQFGDTNKSDDKKKKPKGPKFLSKKTGT